MSRSSTIELGLEHRSKKQSVYHAGNNRSQIKQLRPRLYATQGHHSTLSNARFASRNALYRAEPVVAPWFLHLGRCVPSRRLRIAVALYARLETLEFSTALTNETEERNSRGAY